MEEWRRRSVLATGAALSIGTGLASVGAEASEVDVDELPDPDRDPSPGEDWPSHRGGPGHARYIPDGHEFDGGELEAAWSLEGAGTGAGSVAVADDTVYTSTDDGVLALDAADGTVRWENTDIEAGTPSVADESVYLSGTEVVALDRSDGTVRWESEFDPEEELVWQTVAYGGVYAVADGTLYALEADDGSVRWAKESITAAPHGDGEDEYEFVTAPAAANGVIYSVTGAGPIALEPETGAEVWQVGTYVDSRVSTTYATSAAIAYDGASYEEWPLYDAQTGESATMASGTREIAFGEEIYVGGGTDYGYSGGSIHGDEYDWNLDMTYTYGQAVVSGDTVYAYFYLDGYNYGEREYDEDLVALNKYDGSEKWVLSRDDAPVGHVRAISGETIYVDHDGDLVALRDGVAEDGEQSADDEEGEQDDQSADGEEDGQSDHPADGEEGEGNDQSTDDGEDDQPAEGEGDGGNGDRPDDGAEAENDENDYAGEDENGGAESDDGGNEAVDDGTDDGGTEAVDDGGTESDGESDENGTDDGERRSDDDAVTDNDDEDSGTDGTPGFTTGAGLLGGALGLEWLRRRADPDERIGPDEQTD
ncbi:outer membrane protein assembly factor BamB family protein [Natronococcus jeotgali]|uniref:Pyrrolo-quinoline quinone n=1 Tax=Natronococcus jeotgali DSM 18795 TaxID=1227498 RepID=L9XTK3_9EURY|nr:PQQ-binding-like beta-propeller repeat protein [Natronococcus jeotgali]ELY64726.1 pyrrolo-quinoline quinone [Natronococcus jeotgali DSM 18795]